MPVSGRSGGARAGDAARWESLRPERTVLAVTRTYTSAVRLLEAVGLFGSDFRVGTVFAHDDSSAFSSGVPELLRAAGISPVPLPEVSGAGFDLALTASENIELGRVNAPVVVVPHGIGFHRYVPDSASPGMRLSGVIPPTRLRETDAWMAVSHPGQREQLRSEYPEAAGRCVVVGDLAYDRMVASLPLRERYRRALKVSAGQRLVVVTSTWGTGSLIGAWRELPARLAGELPHDEYRVALVLHPNVWTWHGEHAVRLWLADARAAGLMVMPPSGSWQALLVAADLVIGDHGSVTLYGAALGRPVLLAGDRSKATVVPGTPPDELAETAARLTGGPSDQGGPGSRGGPDGPTLAGQVAAAITAYREGQFASLADRMFARRGEAASALRDFLYSRLMLPAPDAAPVIAAAGLPVPDRSEPCSFVVYSLSEDRSEEDRGKDDQSEEDRIRLWRFPAAVRNAGAPDPATIRHLLAGEEEPDRRLPANASVIVRRAVTGHIEAGAWIDETLARYPGCRLAAVAVPDGCLAGLRQPRGMGHGQGTGHGQRTHLSLPDSLPDACGLAASALYARVRAGQPPSGRIAVRAGTTSFTAVLTPWPAS